ncbi:hypothetical protein BC826DRAFT_421283 [Russula brevipes]|nr:hypothetical protein BC826DRAFT_421283 [Russula brevipes]
MMLDFAPKVFYSRDIPHAVQDLMNTVEVHYRRSGMAKEMFEALIYENTYEDEPNAPRIAIINDDVRDQEEVTPAWEFYYSNRIWHSDGVPLPDFTNLRGCDCEGYCDPKSQTCSCLKKQQEYTGHIPGFIYDDKGRLKQRGFPIFECNDLCGCLDGCRNRVVQHGRQYAVNIRKTSNKGWGIFAGRQKIPKGSFIGIYAGELLTENEGEERGIKYNKFGRTYLFQLDFYHLRPNESSIGDGGDDEWQTKYVMDAYHAGNFTRFLNHSCDPNCAMNACYVNEANPDKPLLALFTRRDVLPWEELCFSYTGYDSDAEDDEDEHLHERGNNGDAVYAKCLCGTSKCKGVMFK